MFKLFNSSSKATGLILVLFAIVAYFLAIILQLDLSKIIGFSEFIIITGTALIGGKTFLQHRSEDKTK